MGLFNFIEETIDPQLLGIHHELPGWPLRFAADMVFLAAGIGIFGLGCWLLRQENQA